LLVESSALNLPATLKRLTFKDIENHIKVIQCMLSTDLKKPQSECLEQVLVEYLCNNDFVFRGKPLWDCVMTLQKGWSEAHLQEFLKKLFQRVHKLHLTPPPKLPTDIIKQSYGIAKKVRNLLSFVIPRGIRLEYATLTTILQLICHPAVSNDTAQLKLNIDYIVNISKLPLREMLDNHHKAEEK
jgi:hypothetical protein